MTRRKCMMLLTAMMIILSMSTAVAMADSWTDGVDVKKENTPAKDAKPPEKVYQQYVEAVHEGDIGLIKKLVYSQSLLLWNRNGKKMLAITRNILPKNPRLLSKKKDKQFQYNYTILTMTGRSPKGGHQIKGQVKMIVEKGYWKVYEEVWR